MKIKDRPEYSSKPKPLAFSPDTLVADVVKEMSRLNYGSVVIINEDGQLIGLVTERDIMKRLVNENKSPITTKVSEIMTTELRVAKSSDDLRDWLRIMSNERFRRLPIVNDNGHIEAIMTQGDFVSYTWPDLLDRAKEMTKASISSNYQIIIIIISMIVYTLLMISVLRAF